jgi:uncharacterized SAM-binding protein YcdF (DUF218 family)
MMPAAMFAVKKALSALLLPLPLCLIVATVGLALLWFTRRQRTGRILVTAALALLSVLAIDGVADLVLDPLEHARPVLVPGATHPLDARARQARFIVVLGGGHTPAPGLPANSELSVVTLARVVEAVRLKNQLPDARMIVSGAYAPDGVPHAEFLSREAQSLGVPAGQIVEERRTWDTADEARLIKERLGTAPFILVTSASHLPRAVRLFRKQGLDPIPSPSDFGALDTPGLSGLSLIPAAGPLSKIERATHEYLGILFSRLRHQL